MYQNWTVLLEEDKHRLFEMQSKIGISKKKYRFSVVLRQIPDIDRLNYTCILLEQKLDR